MLLYGMSWVEVRRLWQPEFRCYCGNPKCIYNIVNNRHRQRKKKS